MKNPDFKKSTIKSTAALAVALITLLLSCIIPELVICGIYDSTYEKLNMAISATASDDFKAAEKYAEESSRLISQSADALMLFFDHADVYELKSAVDSAYYIAQKEDAAQLFEELCSALTLLEAMRNINEASFINLF